MWPFTRAKPDPDPKPDPIDPIVDSLTRRPWEWELRPYGFGKQLQHVATGVWVYESGGSPNFSTDCRQRNRLETAVLACLAAKIAASRAAATECQTPDTGAPTDQPFASSVSPLPPVCPPLCGRL